LQNCHSRIQTFWKLLIYYRKALLQTQSTQKPVCHVFIQPQAWGTSGSSSFCFLLALESRVVAQRKTGLLFFTQHRKVSNNTSNNKGHLATAKFLLSKGANLETAHEIARHGNDAPDSGAWKRCLEVVLEKVKDVKLKKVRVLGESGAPASLASLASLSYELLNDPDRQFATSTSSVDMRSPPNTPPTNVPMIDELIKPLRITTVNNKSKPHSMQINTLLTPTSTSSAQSQSPSSPFPVSPSRESPSILVLSGSRKQSHELSRSRNHVVRSKSKGVRSKSPVHKGPLPSPPSPHSISPLKQSFMRNPDYQKECPSPPRTYSKIPQSPLVAGQSTEERILGQIEIKNKDAHTFWRESFLNSDPVPKALFLMALEETGYTCTGGYLALEEVTMVDIKLFNVLLNGPLAKCFSVA
jgi:hypothetical protein